MCVISLNFHKNFYGMQNLCQKYVQHFKVIYVINLYCGLTCKKYNLCYVQIKIQPRIHIHIHIPLL